MLSTRSSSRKVDIAQNSENVESFSRKRKRDLESDSALEKPEGESSSESDGESGKYGDVSEYERQILKVVEKRNALLKAMGFAPPAKTVQPLQSKPVTPTVRKKRSLKTPESLPKREPSRRIRKLDVSNQPIKAEEPEEEPQDDRLLGTMTLEEGPRIFDKLNTVKYDSGLLMADCSASEFRDQLLSMPLVKMCRVFSEKVQSMHFHPSAEPILFVGGSRGNFGIWNALQEDPVQVHQLHRGALNCISTCAQDKSKVITTSHDGTIIQTDFSAGKSTNIFATDFNARIAHVTWHDELDDQTLLIAHGSGDVGLLDPRVGKTVQFWVDCFEQSVKTVQHHPSSTQCFLASSRTGSFKIFDLRNHKDPVAEKIHTKGLTSAFFSNSGSSIVSTCYDDTIRVFDSQNLSGELPEKALYHHNNHTGRWLSVFKAQWVPGRDDVFHVGSLRNPRTMQFYRDDGSGILAELNDTELTTVTSVIAVHPELFYIAGANSSGKLHLFGPPDERYVNSG